MVESRFASVCAVHHGADESEHRTVKVTDQRPRETVDRDVRRDHISVCICTFRRPDLLARLLDALAGNSVDPAFSFDIVIVDNDWARSAEDGVERFRARSEVKVFYDCEPERNISIARNRAIRNATGNLLAFIDDDEYPRRDWLARLYRSLKESNANGVLGPVLSDFPPGAPRWLEKGGFFDRPRLRSGATISLRDARTGNVLIQRSVFSEGSVWFDPAFGRTGGEDAMFFSRQFDQGRVFVWCDEAPVYEAVPSERWKASFLLRKHLRIGSLVGERIRNESLPRGIIARQMLIFCACTTVVLPSFLLPKHMWMHVLLKLAYCGGVIAAYCGRPILRDHE
jgi:succinoglycan biosynthesis protein ExoM